MGLQRSNVGAKFANLENPLQHDWGWQINRSRGDLMIGGLGAPDHLRIFKPRIAIVKVASGGGKNRFWKTGPTVAYKK